MMAAAGNPLKQVVEPGEMIKKVSQKLVIAKLDQSKRNLRWIEYESTMELYTTGLQSEFEEEVTCHQGSGTWKTNTSRTTSFPIRNPKVWVDRGSPHGRVRLGPS